MERTGQELFDLAKQAFHATMETASKVQQQTHQLMEQIMRQGATAQGEGKRLLSDWVEQSKKQMEEYQKAAAEGYRKWESEVTGRFSALAPATKQDIQEVRQRLDELAKKVEALERR